MTDDNTAETKLTSKLNRWLAESGNDPLPRVPALIACARALSMWYADDTHRPWCEVRNEKPCDCGYAALEQVEACDD